VNVWLVLPIKAPEAAKTRLGPRLHGAGRDEVARRLATRTLATLARWGRLPVVVVTRDPWVAELAATTALQVLTEGGDGHSAAARQGARHAAASGAELVLSLAADLPLLRCADLDALLRRAAAGRAVIAPDRLGLGTNAVLAPADFPFTFGAPSFDRHRRLAESAGLDPIVLRTPGLAVDLDSPWDLDLLA
jgi:2-phospho-L-lactate guanylyltransferase